MERRLPDGTWEAYTAWYVPQHRAHLERGVRMRHTQWDTNNTFRVTEETN